MSNPNLFLHNGTPTSIEAAVHARAFKGQQHTAILAYVRKRPQGATREEIEIGTGISHQSCGPRVVELVCAGLLREDGTKRKTSTGRNAAVLVAGSEQ